MKISDHITYAEAIHSETAKRKGIDNTPNPNQIEAMKLLAEKVFEPLREWVGGPIKVNSFLDHQNLILRSVDQKPHNIVKVKQLILMMFMVIKQTQRCIIG